MQLHEMAVEDLLSEMVMAEDLHRAILEETVQSAEVGNLKESGRTLCPESNSEPRMPIERYPRAVELQSCPRGAVGIMHSHVSVDQMKNPEHSLPDTSNVILGEVDASMVVGTETHETLVSPPNPDDAADRFRDALGLDVESTEDVVNALRNGDIPSPGDARDRVRSRLPELFDVYHSGFFDLSERIDRLSNEGEIPAYESVEAACIHTHHQQPSEPPVSGISARTQAMRKQRSTLARQTAGYIPHLQIQSTGEPISLIDEATRTILMGGVVGAIYVTGKGVFR